MTRINAWGCFFLVALRLAIGWHFFIEGLHKIHSHRVGKTSTNTPWSSEGFFREGYGPAAEMARKALGLENDVNEERLSDQFEQQLMPLPLGVMEHYRFTATQVQQLATATMADTTSPSKWLDPNLTVSSKRETSWGLVELRLAVADLMKRLDTINNELADIANRERPALNGNVDKVRQRSLKTEANGIQAELRQVAEKELAKVKSNYLKHVEKLLTDEQKLLGPPPEVLRKSPLDILDNITMWSHAILGGLLILGLFTRTSSLLLAFFLLAVTLIAPAVPWAPTPPGSTGHYLYINLYTIEMIALLALTFLPTGRWFGVDALFCRRSNTGEPGA